MISEKLTQKNFISLILCLFLTFNAEAKPNRLNKKIRIVALTSITADLINTISKDSLVGIPGSSILRLMF